MLQHPRRAYAQVIWFQVWRPLRGPVKESPLAMIDASTVAKEDLMDLRIEFEGRTGWNYAIRSNPGDMLACS